MARWEPGTAQRLQRAALDLFVSRGYEQTTAAEIAEAAGLTQRTFFRHFSDKRDVFFRGQESYVAAFLTGIDAAPPEASPMTLVAAALTSAAAFFPEDGREDARVRQRFVDEHPSLRERERHKSADLAARMAHALARRGVGEPAATLAAESGVTVFTIAFTRWLDQGEQRSLTEVTTETLASLVALIAGA